MLRASATVNGSGIDLLTSEAKKRNITLRGAKAAGKLLKIAARAEAPARTGALKQAQGVKAAKGTTAGSTASFAVQGARKKVARMVRLPGRKTVSRVVPAFYDHLVQLGTKSHSLAKGANVARPARAGKKATAAVGQAAGRMHPGATANPYRRRAWESVKDRAGEVAVEEMGAATRTAIEKQAAKIAAKAKQGK